MIIKPNENGWSYDDSTGNWKLVYSDKIIVLYEQTDQSIAAQSTLFVGTHEECDEEINRLALIWASETNSLIDENTEPEVTE
jgi:hypothetical protein